MTLQGSAERLTDADITVVGAGPAGAATACHFARSGFSVLLIDQRRFPRDKVCGDFVGPAALAELDELGLCSQPIIRNANKIRNGALYLNGKKVLGRPFPHIEGLRDYGLCIPRMLLDDVIVQAAVAFGARLIEGARVTGYDTDTHGVTLFYVHPGSQKQKCLRTRLLIGADGSSSLISRILRRAKQPRRDRIVAVRAYLEQVQGPADQADLYVNSSSLPGYYWLFPTGMNSANVGIGMLLETWPPAEQQLAQTLAHLIESDPGIRSRLNTTTMFGRIVGWPLATFNPHLPIIGDRVALIGDAAGLINPLTGEGIQYALRSARWIFESLQEALLTDSVHASGLRPYAARVQAEMRYDMAVSRLIVDLTRNRVLNPLWLSTLGLIAKRAASDTDYYDLAAGVFAGSAHASRLLSFPFIFPTTKSIVAGYFSAFSALCGTLFLGGSSPNLTSVPLMFKESVLHPVKTFGWSAECALGVFELAAQMLTRAIQ